MIERNEALTEEGHARRRFLKQAATVAWASPFIVTMMSRSAHATHGAPCGVVNADNTACDVTGAPCGTAHVCVPDFAGVFPAPGDPCFCRP